MIRATQTLLLAAVAVSIAAGCGGEDGGEQQAEFPPGHVNEAGNFYVPVADQAQAEELCDVIDSWPKTYPDQVTFDMPRTGRDLTCIRP